MAPLIVASLVLLGALALSHWRDGLATRYMAQVDAIAQEDGRALRFDPVAFEARMQAWLTGESWMYRRLEILPRPDHLGYWEAETLFADYFPVPTQPALRAAQPKEFVAGYSEGVRKTVLATHEAKKEALEAEYAETGKWGGPAYQDQLAFEMAYLLALVSTPACARSCGLYAADPASLLISGAEYEALYARYRNLKRIGRSGQ